MQDSLLSALQNTVICGDSTKVIGQIPSESVHLILSDIPYGIGVDEWDVLHKNTNSALLGSSPAQAKAGAVFRRRGKPLNGWSEADRQIPHQYYDWCMTWSPEWLRVLKPGGSAIIFAGRRLVHRCICALEDAGFTHKDMLAWLRERAPHRAQRLSIVYERRGDIASAERWEGWRVGNLRPTFEPVLWFTKPYRIGGTIATNVLEHELGAFNEAAYIRYLKSPDNVLSCRWNQSDSGFHPTQKPLRLMQALIELTTRSGHMVLDPFAGSGTTLAAAAALGRRFIGIEQDSDFCDTARIRIEEALRQQGQSSLFDRFDGVDGIAGVNNSGDQ